MLILYTQDGLPEVVSDMDKLEHVFELQHAFDTDLANRRALDFSDRAEWVQREIMALIVEAGELLQEVNYKWWKDPKPIDRDKILDEMADIFHFFLAACLRMGFSADELYNAYCRKNEENFRRQRGESDKHGYRSEAPR